MSPNIRYSVLALSVALCWQGAVQAQVAWVGKYDDALKKASVEGKFVIVDISASWCPPCQKMVREVYPNDEFIEFSRSNVFMLLDADTDLEGVRLARRFRVVSYPTILIIDSRGREVDRLIGGRSAKGLIRDLKEVLDDPIPFEDLERKASEQKDDYQLQFKVGRRALEREEYSRARGFLARAAVLAEKRAPSERAAALILLSAACFKDGKYQDALKALDTLDSLEPKSANQLDSMKMVRARVLMALKRYDEGAVLIRDLLRSSRSREDTDDARKLMAELPGKYRKGDKEFAGLVEKARENLRKGKLDAALEMAHKSAESAPAAAEVHVLLAAIQFQKAKSETAPALRNQRVSSGLHELRLARRLDPEDILSYSEARGVIAHKYLPKYPGAPEARKAYDDGELLFSREKYKDAALKYQSVIKMEPNFGLAYRHMGDCVFAAGKFEEALKWYQLAADKAPQDAAAYRYAAHALTKLGKDEEAGQWLIRSLLADPEYPLVWQDLEQAARRQGRNLERHTEIIPFQFLVLSMGAESYDEKLFDNVPQETVPAWREYVKNKLLWRRERFQKEFPKAEIYYSSFPEELDCLRKMVEAWSSLKVQNPGLRDENLDFLSQVSLDDRLEAFVFLELYTEEYRASFEEWKKKSMDDALGYISEYLIGPPRSPARSAQSSGTRILQTQRAPVNPPENSPPPVPAPEAGGAAAAPPEKPPVDENDPIARLEKRLASARDSAEKDWLYLMLGVAHFQARHWKEAKEHLTKVLEKDPDNLSAREMMKAIEKNLRQ